MRIIWNDQHSWFQAELSQGELWQDDENSVQAAGFRTEGPPTWTWYCTQSKPLNKLRDLRPKSGITLTELALQKYTFLENKAAEKAALKKKIKELKKLNPEPGKESKFYFDQELGFECMVIEPGKSDFKWVPPIHPEPAAQCIICGGGLYIMDYDDVCLWCDKEQKKTLDKQN